MRAALLVVAFLLPGCMGCLGEGHWYVTWMDPALYAAVSEEPAPPIGDVGALPFDVRRAGLEPTHGMLIALGATLREGGSIELLGPPPDSEASARIHALYTHNASAWMEEDVARWLVEVSAWDDAEARAAAADLVAQVDATHPHWQVLRAPLDAPLRLDDLYGRVGAGAVAVERATVGSSASVQAGTWGFGFWMAKKVVFLEEGILTSFATGDARFSFEGERKGTEAAVADVERVLTAHGLPHGMGSPTASFSGGCW